MMASTNAGAAISDLRKRVDGLAAALIARDGGVLAADLPDKVHAETFAIMCATVVGAAATANAEMHRSPPRETVIQGEQSTMILLGCGTRALLVVVVGPTAEPTAVVQVAHAFVELLAVN